MDVLLPIVQPLLMTAGILLLIIAVMQGRKRCWRSAARPLVSGVVVLAMFGGLETVWERKHQAFHELAWRLANRHGSCPNPFEEDPAVRPVSARVSLSVDARTQRVVWRGFSLRRRETYDCATGEFRLH